MAITSSGYQGTVNEAQWSRLFDGLPYWVRTGFTATAVAGQRQISMTIGEAFGRGVRVVTDAPVVVPFTPPSSGGQWHLVVLRRTWGSSAASTVVDLPAAATDGTVPLYPPTTSLTTVAGFQNLPGTVDDQPLYWVHVRAADTTLTFFDLKSIATAAGGLRFASPYGLQAWHSLGLLGSGSIVSIADWVEPVSGNHIRESVWRNRNNPSNLWVPVERIWAQTTAALTGLAQTMTALPGLSLEAGLSRGYVENTDITYLYVGSGNTTLGGSSVWQAWSKRPTSFTPAWTNGLNGTAVANNIGLWGISEGELWVNAFTQYSAAPTIGASTEVALTLPSMCVGYLGVGNGTYQQAGSSAANNQVDLVAYVVGTAGQATTSLRVRQRYALAATAPVRQNAGLGVTGQANDYINIDFRGPSALVA